MFHCRSRFEITGRFTATSHVWFASVPAFCHCVENPSAEGVGTFRIWFLVLEFAFVTSTPTLLNSVKSAPTSVSVVVSGFRVLLPACPSEQPVALHEYVSYCAAKLGVFPAVPREARMRKSLTPLTFQNGSSDARHTADMRPNGAQRLPEPNSELPSYRKVPSTMYLPL